MPNLQTQNIYIRKPQINTAYDEVFQQQSPVYTSGLKKVADKKFVDSMGLKPVEMQPLNFQSFNTFNPQIPAYSQQLKNVGVSTDLSTFNLGNSKAGVQPSLGEYTIHEPLSDQPYNYLNEAAEASSKGSVQPMISNMAFGVTTGIQSIKNVRNQMAINEPTPYIDAYNAYGNKSYYGDYADLYQQGLERTMPNMPTYDEIRGKSKNQIIGDIASSGLQGTLSGLSTGNPWMALIGGAMGFLTSGIGAIAGKNNAESALKEIEAARDRNKYNNQKQYQYALDNAILRNQYNLKGNIFSMGGFFPTGIEEISKGGTHETNPLGGIPFGIDETGNPNLVEEGEVIFDNYVFSDRLTIPESVKSKYKFGNKKGMTFADAASKVRKEFEERPNDPITKNGVIDKLSSLMAEQEFLKENIQMGAVKSNKFGLGGNVSPEAFEWVNALDDASYQNLVNGFTSMPANKKKKALADRNYLQQYGDSGRYGEVASAINQGYLNTMMPNAIPTAEPQYPTFMDMLPKVSNNNEVMANPSSNVGDPNHRQKPSGYATWMRYAPVVGSGISVLTDLAGLTNKPDYSDINKITDIAGNVTKNPDTNAQMIGNYVKFNPLDTSYMANRAAAQASTTRQAIQQNANGNRAMAMAGLLAADRNAQNTMGDLYRQAEEYNMQQRLAVENFNRGTNQYNADNVMKARIANQQNKASQYHLLYDAAVKKAMLKSQLDAQASASRSANLTNFFNNLGEIGKENMAMNMVNSQNALYYSIDKKGNVHYKNAFYKLPKEEQNKIKKQINN